MPYDPNQPRDPGGEHGGWWIKAGTPAIDEGKDPEAASLANYLRKVAEWRRDRAPKDWAYGSNEEYLLANGQFWIADRNRYAGGQNRLGRCFADAYHFVDANPEYRYVEGYATVSGVPLLHAWAVDPEGHVVDPSWGSQPDYNPAEHRYFGAAFDMNVVRTTMMRRGFYGVLPNEEEQFPLLRGAAPPPKRRRRPKIRVRYI